MDTEIYDAATDVRTALWAAFTAPGVTNPPHKQHLSAGAEIPADDTDCCLGLLYVLALESSPLEGSEQLGGVLAFDQHFIAGVLRCVPTVSDTGVQPTPAMEDAAVRQILIDQLRLMKTMQTYVRSLPLVADGDYSDITALQLEPSGGCGGAVIDFHLTISEDCTI